MFFTNNLIFLGVLIFAITCCVAEEEEKEENSLFSTNIDDLSDTPFTDFSDDFSLFGDLEENLDGSPQADLIESSSSSSSSSMIAWDNDEDNGTPSIFADSNQGCSSMTTSQLLFRRLSARGAGADAGAAACDNPEGNRESSGLFAPTINPKVAPWVDIETMELKQICPSQLPGIYSVAVCSSGVHGDVMLWKDDANFDLFWALKST